MPRAHARTSAAAPRVANLQLESIRYTFDRYRSSNVKIIIVARGTPTCIVIVDYSVEDPFQNRQLVSHDGSGKRYHVKSQINFRLYRTLTHVVDFSQSDHHHDCHSEYARTP